MADASSFDEPSSATPVEADLHIDISRLLCPMTFVRTRLALDRLEAGQVLAVRLRGEEPRRNVPATAAEQGHRVLGLRDAEDGCAIVLIEKGVSRAGGAVP